MPANYKLTAGLQMARTKIYPASRYYTGPRVPGEIYGSMGRPLKRLRKSGVPTASLTEEQGSSAIQAARPVSTGQQSVDIGTIDCASPSREEPAQSTSREPEAPEEPEARATSVAPSTVQRVAFQYVLPLFTACNGRHDDGSAPQESLAVASNCSTDHETWLAGGSILYPARLQATLDTEPAGSATAHASPADLAAHSSYFAALFRQLNFSPLNIARLPVTAPVTQAQLHQVIEALYSKQLRLDMQSAEAILRTAHYLDLSCVQASAELFIARHFIPIAPVEVRLLAAELSLPGLVTLAEDAAVRGPWTGPAGQELQDMLQGMPTERVAELLHHPYRSAASELEVVDLLSQMSDNSGLASAVRMEDLLRVERDTLACAYAHLPAEQRQTPFWADLSSLLVKSLVADSSRKTLVPGTHYVSVPASIPDITQHPSGRGPSSRGTVIGHTAVTDGATVVAVVARKLRGEEELVLEACGHGPEANFDRRNCSLFLLNPCCIPMVYNRTSVKLNEPFKLSRLAGHYAEALSQAEIMPRQYNATRLFVGLHISTAA